MPSDRRTPVAARCAVRVAAAAVLCAATAGPAAAIRPDECEQQRALYPQDWTAVAGDTALFECQSRDAGALVIRLGGPDRKGRRLMSLVPLERRGDGQTAADPSRQIHRIWLDAAQARRLTAGRYFATVVRTAESCWVRGDLSGDPVFIMDNADPPADSRDASAFYNKAPRLSAFRGQAYFCEPVR